jgi:homoserine trans-succinylase
LAALEDSASRDRVEEEIEVTAASAVHSVECVCWAVSASMANGYYEQSAARHEKLFFYIYTYYTRNS